MGLPANFDCRSFSLLIIKETTPLGEIEMLLGQS